MPNTVLGKVSCVPRGDYSASTTYYALDIVGYNGGSYLAMQQVTGVTPSNDQVNWMQLSGPGLPGKQGPQGNPGAAAGFGEATATVDDTSGTPSVEVETSGPDTAKVFTFKFYGLKGTKGDTGNKGDTGDTGPVGPQGVSVVTAQINEQGHLIITLSEGEPIDAGDATGPIGPQGIQGEAGESVGSIQRTSGTGAPGTTDTYTMYSTDGSQIGTFTVYNGTNGTGAGDFMADGSVPMTGALDMGGQRVTNVGAPTASTDAVRQSDLKAVSDEVADIISGTTAITIPAATKAKRGGVIIGEGLSVTEDGTVSADDQLPTGGTRGQVLTQGTTGPEWQDAPSGLPDGGAPGQVLTQGESGPEWTNAPAPLPSGGETGQVLTKTADGAAWDDVPSDLPSGGTDGQILTKTADGVAWEDAPEGGVTSFKGRTGAVTPQEGDYTAGMVGARPDTWTPSAADVGAVPTSRTVNGKALSQDINLTADNVGARPSTWTPTASDVGAIPNPSGGTAGQILEKTATGTQWADKPSGGIPIADATSTDGLNFTASIPNVTELKDGLCFFLYFRRSVNASSGVNLNINNLGNVLLLRTTSAESGTFSFTSGLSLAPGATVFVVYNGTSNHFIILSNTKPIITDIVAGIDTDYTASHVRGISLQTSVPSRITNGSIVGVYST